MGIKVNKYQHCCWEAKGSSSKLSGAEDDVYWLNKITFIISVSAYWIYSALKKAAKWRKVLPGKRPGTISQPSSISTVLWEECTAQITLLKNLTVVWKRQKRAFRDPLSRPFFNQIFTPGLASDESCQKIKNAEMSAEGPWVKKAGRWKRKPTPLGC